MSASDKKKLRKEQTAAAMTEKQRTEQKKQKKQTAYTITFIVAMVLVVAIFLSTALQAPVRNLQIKLSTGVTVNGHKVSGTELNYFYLDGISNFCSNFSSYGNYAPMMMQMYYGFNPNAPLGDQVRDEKTGETWADYFADAAIESAKWTYAMYDKAMAEGFKLTEEQEKNLTAYEEYLKTVADRNNVSTNKYVKSIYGGVGSFKTYTEYYKVSNIAAQYASKHYDSLKFEAADLREYEKDKYNEYSSYSYAYINLTVNTYLTGGTKVTGEDGKTTTTYSDEEKKAAVDAALADAKKLAENKEITSVEKLNEAIKALEKFKDGKTTCTEVDETLYSSLKITNEDMKKWVTSGDRKAGDLTYFTNSTKTDGKETVGSYTVVLFLGVNENTSYEGNVLHLLVKFEGGKKDPATNVTTYTEIEKKKAKDEAEKLLAEFKSGTQTKEAFIELLKKHTDDVDSKGKPNNDGLYENITPASGYVKPFKDWAYADHKPGDTGIIETDYGYHIMYYVEDGEHTYRDLLIETDMKNEAYEKWEEELLKALTVVESKNVVVNKDFIVPASYYTGYSY